MITPLEFKITADMLESMIGEIPFIDFKLTINNPTGDFFYDPWEISSKFKGTIWEKVLSTLPYKLGEARLIKLPKKECYMAHADIDNRWHLPIVSGKSFLVDLENKVMHTLRPLTWHYMDAGKDHSAVNFGGDDRVQLVIRELLTNAKLKNPKQVIIKPKDNPPNHIRYIFDYVYSPILNKLNYSGKMNSFKIAGNSVMFNTEQDVIIPTHENFLIL